MKMKKIVMAMATLALIATGAHAAVIVQWSEPGGTNAIVDGAANFVSGTVTTNYTDGQADVYSDSGYYTLNPNTRSPLFQVSSSESSFDSAQTQNNTGYDRTRLVADVTYMEAMFVWDDFLTLDDEVTSFSWYGYAAGETSADLYFIIKKGSFWYASLGSDSINSHGAADIADASAATWYSFTPIANGTATIGSQASIDMSGVSAVGFYMLLPNGSGVNIGPYNGYFQATADGSGPPVNQPPSFSNDPINKPNADIDVAYTDSIAGDASDPESDTMTFSLTSPASWLSVASNGIISGTPHSTNVGVNAFTVQVAATGGVDSATLNITVNAPPPELTGWEQFVTNYSLSGNMFDDEDLDTVIDVYEFAHGGDPTNPADTGTAPHIEYGAGNIASFICLETAHTNPGITYTAEWIDSLSTNNWSQSWDATNTVASALAGYNEVERQLNGAANQELFFRNRLFDVPSGERGRPNILFIQCDDLGYSDVGFNAAIFGEKPSSTVSPKTPNIDNLATGGMIFKQAYCSHPFCGPSRMGLITGRYPHHFGGSKNLPYETKNLPDPAIPGYEPANDLGIPVTEVTMAKVLQDAGYHTGAIGKWHLGIAPHTHPNNVGFDYWFGFLGGGHSYYAPWLSITDPSAVNDYQFWLTRNGAETNILTGYLTDILSDDAIDFIEATPTDQPFFLYMNYNAPHTPHHAKPEDLKLLYGGSGNNDDYEMQELIQAMMYSVDRGVSNIVETLTAKGLLDNTMIVFLSDNGGKVLNDADNGPLTGGKGNTTEGGIRTPMFIHYPNALMAGTYYDHPVAMYDFYPTFAGLGEATIPNDKVLSGTDIWDAVLNDQNANTNTMVWVRHNANGHQLGLRKGNLKAHKLNNGRWKLYDLSTDLGETNDIEGTSGALDAILDGMVDDGYTWGLSGVDPLFHDTQKGYEDWEANNMPKYDEAFQYTP